MNINIKENNKNIEEFNLLYNSVGWGLMITIFLREL